MRPAPNVQVGQVWIDNDKRQVGPAREIRVVEFTGEYAVGQIIGSPRKTKIRLDRFRPTATGYRLKEGGA